MALNAPITLSDVSLVLNQYPFTHFATDGDAVSWGDGRTMYNLHFDAGGAITPVSNPSRQSRTLTVRLMFNSPDNQFLTRRANDILNGKHVPFNGSVSNAAIGLDIELRDGVMVSASDMPTLASEGAPPVAEYTFTFASVKSNPARMGAGGPPPLQDADGFTDSFV